MKSNKKYFCLGVITGSIVFGSVLSFANDLLNVVPNPFKIKVNNVEQFIEGYNINGSSYFKLRDIGERVGFNVNFKENTIMINTTDDNTTIQNGYELQDTDIVQTADKVVCVHDVDYNVRAILVNNDIYYLVEDVNTFLKHCVVYAKGSNIDKGFSLYRSYTKEVLIDSIPVIMENDRPYISEDYVYSDILPLDKE